MKKIVKMVCVAVLAMSIVGCTKEEPVEEEKVTEGALGDSLTTMFFQYTVNEAYLASELSDMIPEEGYQFLVTNITVTNPSEEEPVKMSGTDFWVEGSEKADPLSTYADDTLVEDSLPNEYTIEAQESMSGNIVFVVPSADTEFKFMTQDYYSTSESEEIVEGDIYTITFKAELKEGE